MALYQLTLWFELQNTSERKGKGLKVAMTNMTLKGGSKVKSEQDSGHMISHKLYSNSKSLRLIIEI